MTTTFFHPLMDTAAPDQSSDEPGSDPRWRAVLARDRAWDGAFVFAVSSTRIFCRPSCPSRRPRADRVAYFPDAPSARSAGYRACKRCTPEAITADATTAAVVRALEYLDAHEGPTTLDELAEVSGVSRSHLQRQFTRLVGCSPQEWQIARRAERLRLNLRSGESVSRAALDAGFESLPRAYAAAEQHLGMPPGAYRRGAPGETVFFTVVPCALGQVLVAMTSRGVCRVILGDDAAVLSAQLRDELHEATLVADDAAMREVATAVAAAASGAILATPLPLDLRGTAFQQRVWRELTRIPRGETITYAELARRVGSPGAVRAVGSACGANPAAVIVPCHRVLRSDGALGGYRWGLERKALLLDRESRDAPAS
jgi:AraC family transcriptional regulator of adaptative response/methylated-DNA-[protein]-cysteine methyltransferase